METLARRFARYALEQVGKRSFRRTRVLLTDRHPEAFTGPVLLQWLFFRCGYRIPEHINEQYSKASPMTHGTRLRAGDCYFFKDRRGRATHGGVCIGGGWCVEARGKMSGVTRRSVADVKARGGIFRRFIVDLDGRPVLLDVDLSAAPAYWVLIFTDGINANKLKKFAVENDCGFEAKVTDRTSILNIKKQAELLV